MKRKTLICVTAIAALAGCASEFEIASSDVPPAVLDAFKSKYPNATGVEWEVEKKDGRLYFEAEFDIGGKEKEAYFRPDGTFSSEE
jgi:hypothetical protein